MNGARNVFYTQKRAIEAGLGVGDAAISNTLAAGYLVYACGKLLYGFATDRFGGKTIYVYCFAGVGLVTMAFWFARSGAALTALWIASRFFQPAGYLGQSKLVANWFVHTELARVMAWLSVFHYLFDVHMTSTTFCHSAPFLAIRFRRHQRAAPCGPSGRSTLCAGLRALYLCAVSVCCALCLCAMSVLCLRARHCALIRAPFGR